MNGDIGTWRGEDTANWQVRGRGVLFDTQREVHACKAWSVLRQEHETLTQSLTHYCMRKKRIAGIQKLTKVGEGGFRI